ncbi:MAG: glycosyltransferase family 2 protein [Planctomycetota bacterium]|jgi:glycosyltransferase involved in cell wall biosynthesis
MSVTEIANVIDRYNILAEKKDAEHCEQKIPVYIVITPAFNEEKHIEATIDSIISQKARPQVWVIVDDGSSDKTWEIIKSATISHSWIKGCRRHKETSRGNDGLLVASEAAAFLDGLRMALEACPRPDFIVKLDADLKFGPEYFTVLFNEFSSNPRLGITGGVIYEYKGSGLVRDKANSAHVRGATKIYRYACYEDIGGVRSLFGWDVIDEMIARASGWHVKSFDHAHLIHLRQTASRDGRFAGWARNGYMAYYIGMSPVRMFLRVFFRLIVTGDVTQSCGLSYGYFRNFFRRAQQLPDPSLRKLVRRHQWMILQAGVPRKTLKKVGKHNNEK